MIRRTLAAVGVLLLFSASITSSQVMLPVLNAGNQNPERIIITKGANRSPLKMRGIRAKGKQVEPNKGFGDSDDWLKELTVEVTNDSDKTITFVQIQLFFPRPETDTGKPGVAFDLDFGDNPFAFDSAADMPPVTVKPVLPGKHVEVALSDSQFVALTSLLIDSGFLVTNKVEIRVDLIGFSDGTAWSGQMVQRRPTGGWMPLKDVH